MPRLFGEKLRTLRSKSQMTQAALARQIDAKRAHINNLEVSRRSPSLQLIIQVADLFAVTTDYLLRDDIPVEPIEKHVIQHTAVQESITPLFGEKLMRLRVQQNLSQVEVAQKANLTSRGYVSNLETGRKAPAPDLVPLLADLFGVTTDYLLRDIAQVERKSPIEHATNRTAENDA